jgi:NAD(P)H-quinone oxidoreductase subunit 4L
VSSVLVLKAFLLVAAALMGLGLWGTLSQMSIVMVMMGFELMLNGILLSVVALWRFVAPGSARGQVFAIMVLLLMAVEMAFAFAIVIAVYRARQEDTVDSIKDLRG